MFESPPSSISFVVFEQNMKLIQYPSFKGATQLDWEKLIWQALFVIIGKHEYNNKSQHLLLKVK